MLHRMEMLVGAHPLNGKDASMSNHMSSLLRQLRRQISRPLMTCIGDGSSAHMMPRLAASRSISLCGSITRML